MSNLLNLKDAHKQPFDLTSIQLEKLVDGNPVAKRGQVPGVLSGARLNKLLFSN